MVVGSCGLTRGCIERRVSLRTLSTLNEFVEPAFPPGFAKKSSSKFMSRLGSPSQLATLVQTHEGSREAAEDRGGGQVPHQPGCLARHLDRREGREPRIVAMSECRRSRVVLSRAPTLTGRTRERSTSWSGWSRWDGRTASLATFTGAVCQPPHSQRALFESRRKSQRASPFTCDLGNQSRINRVK